MDQHLSDPFWTSEPTILAYRSYANTKHYRFAEINPFLAQLSTSEKLNAYARLDIFLTVVFASMAAASGDARKYTIAILLVGGVLLGLLAMANPGSTDTVQSLRWMDVRVRDMFSSSETCYIARDNNPWSNWLPGDSSIPCRESFQVSQQTSQKTSTYGDPVRGVQVPDPLNTYGDFLQWCYGAMPRKNPYYEPVVATSPSDIISPSTQSASSGTIM
jgi:hypothetical protein